MKPTRIAAGCLGLVFAFLFAFALQARGAATASDNPCNTSSAISSGLNTGSGFAAWTSVSGSYYYGGSGISGDACTSHDWGMFDGGGVTSCQRPFTSANGVTSLQVGQKIVIDMANGGVQSGGTEGFSLYNASSQALWEIYYKGSDSWYIKDGSGETKQSGIPYANGGIRVSFTLTPDSSHYSAVIEQPVGTSKGTFTGTFQSQGGGSAITQLRWFTSNIGGGNNLQVGQMGVSCPDTLAIGTQPTAQTVCSTPGSASFTVGSVTGDSVTYQWRKNGSALSNGGSIANATTATL